MKKILLILIIVTFLITCTEQKLLPDHFLIYNNQQIKIGYPEEWNMFEGFFGSIVSFFPPNKTKGSVNIVIDEDLNNMDLKEFVDYSVEQELPSIFEDFKLINKDKIKVGNLPAYKIVYTSKLIDTAKQLQIITIKDNKAYILTYTAVPESYSDYIDIVNNMINYFEIIG